MWTRALLQIYDAVWFSLFDVKAATGRTSFRVVTYTDRNIRHVNEICIAHMGSVSATICQVSSEPQEQANHVTYNF
jgi:hypothetical protein